jgi:hypothetical protein
MKTHKRIENLLPDPAETARSIRRQVEALTHTPEPCPHHSKYSNGRCADCGEIWEKHTPEPWAVVEPVAGQFAIVPQNRTRSAESWTLAYVRDFQHNDVSNAARIVACVNACEGIADPGAVPELMAALRELMTGHSMAGQAMAEKAIARATGEKEGGNYGLKTNIS